MKEFDAIILAGYDRDKADPLTAENGVQHKALIPVQGRPMIAYVVEALRTSGCIKRIAIVGLGPEDGVPENGLKEYIDLDDDIHFLPDQGSLSENGVCGYEWASQLENPTEHTLLASADVPLLRGEHIAWFAQACEPLDLDLYWGIVSKETMEALFPNSKRSYLRLKEGHFCSGDLFLGSTQAVLHKRTLLRQMAERRKSIFQQLRLLGPSVVFKFLTRRLAIDELLEVVQRALGLQGKGIIVPFAEVGMDVDKPIQLDMVLDHLERQ